MTYLYQQNLLILKTLRISLNVRKKVVHLIDCVEEHFLLDNLTNKASFVPKDEGILCMIFNHATTIMFSLLKWPTINDRQQIIMAQDTDALDKEELGKFNG